MHLSSCRQRKCHAMLVLQPTVQGRWLCAPRFQVGFGHSFLGTDCNRTTISRGHETGSTLSAVSIYGHRFSAFWLRTVKTFYEKLVNPSPRRLPCTFAWEGKLSITLPWRSIWPSIYGGLSTNWEADIAWRLAHGVIKTRAFLKRWRRLRVSERCATCGLTESFSHAFCECTNAPQVWAWVFQIIHPFYSNAFTLSPALVFFGHGLPQDDQSSKANSISRFLFNITLNEIWAARNLRTFEQKGTSAQAVINKIKTRVRTRLSAAYAYYPPNDFIKTWAHMGILCSVDNDELRLII